MTPRRGDIFLATSPDGARTHRIHCCDVFQKGAIRRMVAGDLVAALAADPPYCSGGSTTTARRAGKKYVKGDYVEYEGDHRSDLAFLDWGRIWLADALEVAAPECYVFVWSDWRQVGLAGRAIEMGGWHRRGIAVWDKGASARLPSQSYFRHQGEFCTWGTRGVLRPRFEKEAPAVAGVFTQRVDRKKIHQHQKPVEVWSWLFGILADRPGVILDPFGGSLSSVVAADQRGRVAVAAEQSPLHLEKGIDRLRECGFHVQVVDTGDPREQVLGRIAAGDTVRAATRAVGRSTSWLYKVASNDNRFHSRLQRAKGGVR